VIRRRVVISPEAKQDLLDIYEWVADRASARTALAYIERIEKHCLAFDLAAKRGSLRNDVRPGLRVIGFERSLTIAFSVDETSVTILRLYRRGRNWTRDPI
jgi:toxin ParE1/3/4